MSNATAVEPMVTRFGLLDMQVCVPTEWTDAQVVEFAENKFPCGTTAGWQIRREGSPLLSGSPERAPCGGDDARGGFVHIVLDA